MARRLHHSLAVFEDVNLLLFIAWERGARHVALCPEGNGIQIKYLARAGDEHIEHVALSYSDTLKHLRRMSARLGRFHVAMGGDQWIVDAVIPDAMPLPSAGAFLHMRRPQDD